MAMAMRQVFLVLALLALAGCMKIEAVHLRHPQTGQTVQCGPHGGLTAGNFAATALLQRGCIEDYKQQGFQRVSGS